MSYNISNLMRGDLIYVDFGIQTGSLQSGKRPAIIVSNNNCNKFSPTIHVVPLTTRNKKRLPTHVEIKHSNLKDVSLALVEQTTVINKTQILDLIGYIDEMTMSYIDKAIKIQQGLEIKDNRHLNEKFDHEYLEKMIYLIQEADIKYLKYRDDYFLISKRSAEHTLEMYCEKFRINYNKIINKQTQIAMTC